MRKRGGQNHRAVVVVNIADARIKHTSANVTCVNLTGVSPVFASPINASLIDAGQINANNYYLII